jgi:hypothetical protein
MLPYDDASHVICIEITAASKTPALGALDNLTAVA